ncbi:MAG: branched-chain-amino-acid transaminase [Defluviitaleaceae bacterium]|nr:branched-chain-amino-acid transaminase [Defluviitaleaceae bacterium]
MNPNISVYIDGEYKGLSEAKVSVFDHGLLYGDGVFEGIRAYNGRAFKLDEHIKRFLACAKAIKLELPLNLEELKNVVLESFRCNSIRDGYVRLVATRGVGDLGISPTKCEKPTIICIADSITVYPPEMYETGIPVITAQQRRNNSTILDPQIKSLNYLNNILAKIEANQAGAQEAIMLAQNGVVAECTVNNMFIVKDGIIYTPPIYCGALDGITRQTVIVLAREAGYELYEKEFTLFNVYNADECFLTGTGAECISVTSADGRVIGTGSAGPVTKRILTLYRDYVQSNGTEIYN